MNRRRELPCVILVLTIFCAPNIVWAQAKFALTSSAFAPGTAIPSKYTCSGADESPPLQWSGVPHNAKSFALVVDDPDAPSGTFVHWVIFDLPESTMRLDNNLPKRSPLSDGAMQGTNSFGSIGYRGPCPPPGAVHHYHFRLRALDSTLALGTGATADAIDNAAQGHTIATTELIGTYSP